MGDPFVVGKKEVVVNIRGDDGEFNICGQYRRIGEESGWSVDEWRGFDELSGKMLTRQVYAQVFEEPADGDVAAEALRGAIAEVSTFSPLFFPSRVSP